MSDALTSHLVSGTPELQFAIDEVPTAEAVATVVHVVQSEPSAADRGLEVLAALADDEAKYWRDPPGLELALGRLLDHVAAYEGRPPPADGRAQLAAVERLLARCATAALCENALRRPTAAALCALVKKAAAGYEAIVPRVLCAAPADGGGGGEASLVEAVKAVAPALTEQLRSAAEAAARERAVKACAAIWERAPALEAPRNLAAVLVNATLPSALYEPTAKVRLAAVKLLAKLAEHLDAGETAKLAALRARDQAADVRHAAVRILAAVPEAGTSLAKGAHFCLDPQLVDAMVRDLHVTRKPSDAHRAAVATLFWRFVDAHAAAAGGDAASALRLLHAVEQLHVYEWLLTQHPERLHAQMEAASTRGG